MYATQLFKLSLQRFRASQYEQNLAKSLRLKEHPKSKSLYLDASQDVRTTMLALKHELQSLQWQFEEIEQQMRAADYIAVTSPVETSQADGFSASLESVSDYISAAAIRIKRAIETNHNTLDELERVLK